jgi:hypothetical protein
MTKANVSSDVLDQAELLRAIKRVNLEIFLAKRHGSYRRWPMIVMVDKRYVNGLMDGHGTSTFPFDSC